MPIQRLITLYRRSLSTFDLYLYRSSKSSTRDVQVHHPVLAQFVGELTTWLSAFAIGEHPVVEVWIIHHIYVFSSVDFADVAASVVQRQQTLLVHPSHQHVAREVFGHSGPLRKFRFRLPIVGPTRLLQSRKVIHAAEAVPVRV